MVYLALLVGVIILAINNSKLKKENYELKKGNNKDSFCPNCGYNLINNRTQGSKENNSCDIKTENKNNLHINYNINEEMKKNQVVKTKHTEKEIKNSIILSVGAFLIIIAAIIFLTSTWNISNNFFKTGTLILMLFVFLAGSFIADRFLNIKNTSKVFLYITLSYIPIIFLSVSIFGLFGRYLSIDGNGSNIYFFVTSTLISIMYTFVDKNIKSIYISILNIIFQVLAAIFCGLIFSSNIGFIIVFLMIYLLLISIIYTKKVYIHNEIFHKIIISTLNVSLTLVELFYVLNLLNRINVNDILFLLIALANTYILFTKILNSKNIYDYIYPFIITLIFVLTPSAFNLNNITMITQMSVIISVITLTIISIISDKKIKNGTFIAVLISLLITYFISQLIKTVVPLYIFPLTCSIFLLLKYVLDKNKDVFTAIIFNFTFSIFILNIYNFYNFPIWFLIATYSSLLLLNNLFIKKDENFILSNSIIMNIFVLSSYIYGYFNYGVSNSITLIFSSLIFTLYVILYLYKKEKFYKFVTFILTYFTTYTIFMLLNIDSAYLIFFISNLINIIIDLIDKKNTDNVSVSLITIGYITSSILSIIQNDIYSFLAFIIFNSLYAIYIKINKKNILYIVCILSLIPFIYYSNILSFNGFNYMYILSILIIGSLIYSNIKNENFKLFDFMVLIFILFHMTTIELSKYVSLLILIIVFIIYYLTKKEKKDLYKFIIYSLITIGFEFIFYDVNILKYTVLRMGAINILLLLTTRTIIKNHNNDYKILEYIFSSIINFIALATYNSQNDAILYLILIAVLVIFSYICKFGPYFLVNVIFIVINVFILTKKFWFSIPWWIYILTIGIIFILFAIRNEIKDNKEKKENKLKKLKDHLDL